MKHIQVIDSALNAAYCIFGASDHDFAFIFPNGQDVEFVEDLVKRAGKARASRILSRLWRHPINKKTVRGIHGTLFFELTGKKPFYPTKRELEMTGMPPQFKRFQSPG